jgi:hypothetical protein
MNDVSGVAWVEDDLFLTVQDAKGPEWPRITLVRAAVDRSGVLHRVLDLPWPDSISVELTGRDGAVTLETRPGIAWDLESVARIPGTNQYLLAESGDNARGSRRIFLVEFEISGVGPDGAPDPRLTLLEIIDWPAPIFNVEATAVVGVEGGLLVFLYAERSQGSPHTDVHWASLTLDPVAFGPFSSERFTVPVGLGMNRPIVALDVTAAGEIIAAAAYDPDEDDGPFTSAVYRIGTVGADTSHPSGARVRLLSAPALLGEMNGLKIEGVAVRERPGHPLEIFYGTDDEYFGGILRVVFPR